MLVDEYADTPLIAFTHLQPAEPSTLGYRLAQYAQDLLEDYRGIGQRRAELRGKGFKGAVGTAASYAELIGVENLDDFERKLSERLDLEFFPVATQVYPRKQDYVVLSALAGLGASLYKMAFDLRLLQSPPLGAERTGAGRWARRYPSAQPGPSREDQPLGRYLAGLPALPGTMPPTPCSSTLDDSPAGASSYPRPSWRRRDAHTMSAISGLRVDRSMARNLESMDLCRLSGADTPSKPGPIAGNARAHPRPLDAGMGNRGRRRDQSSGR
jgi:hypothetical protein